MLSRELQKFFVVLRTGDHQAVQSELARIDPSLRRIIHARLQDSRLRRVADTGDIAQSLFKDFLYQSSEAGPTAYQSPGIHAYLAVAATRKIRERLRKHRMHSVGFSDQAGLIDPGASQSAQVEDRDLIECLRNRLLEDCRRLFDLILEGLTWPEISRKLGGTPDALRMKLRRALADALTEMGEEPFPRGGRS
jgi:DNA-directed RNA polymerase specialized sigma24 family protein